MNPAHVAQVHPKTVPFQPSKHPLYPSQPIALAPPCFSTHQRLRSVRPVRRFSDGASAVASSDVSLFQLQPTAEAEAEAAGSTAACAGGKARFGITRAGASKSRLLVLQQKRPLPAVPPSPRPAVKAGCMRQVCDAASPPLTRCVPASCRSSTRGVGAGSRRARPHHPTPLLSRDPRPCPCLSP